MSIVTECMVVNLQVGLWTGFRLDKEASLRVTADAGAESDAARVNKHIIPKETLKPIQTAASAIRTHFYAKTLPWKDNGDRLLVRTLATSFLDDQRVLIEAYDKEVRHFLKTTYAQARERASFRMGELFNENDYPPPRRLKDKFYAKMDIDPVSTASDFRVQMDKNLVNQIKADMEAALHARFNKAMAEVWNRLAETLGHYVKKIGSDEIFRNSTVENLKEIIDLLPDLNILNDPDLEKIRKDIKKQLMGYDPDALRNDKAIRKEAAGEAKRIMQEMAGFMNAFNAAA